MDNLSELCCGECGCIIAYYKPSGAPHYHYYYCETCANEIDEDEE